MDAISSSKGQSIVSTIENDKVNDLTKEVWSLRKTVVEQQKQIDALKDIQGNINDCLRAQERYTRKDSVLIINPPFDARTAKDVTSETLVFFEKLLQIKLAYCDIKACHIVPGTL